MELDDHNWDAYFANLLYGDGVVSNTDRIATRFKTLFQFSLLTFGLRAGV